jgi:uncharacterized protein (DUF2141 family)
MLRRVLLATALTLLAGSAARAETYADKLKAVAADKKTVTLPVDGKDRTFKVDEKVDVQSQVRMGKRLRLTPVKDGLKGVKAGTEVTVTTEKKDGEEVVTKIVVLPAEKK